MGTFRGTLDIYYASAGTGKTTELLNILERHLKAGIQPEEIGFVTFTKAAAEVAKLRTAERFGIPLSRLKNFRTIHSLAFKGTSSNRQAMMDESKYLDFGEQAGFDFRGLSLNTAEGVDWNSMKDSQLVQIEQLYRNNPKYCEYIMDGRCEYGALSEYIRLYKKYKDVYNYKDFTDLLEEYLNTGKTEDVKVVCLDEMQDSSPLQWRVVFQAFQNVQHMYVAGDIKQCIYGFAGASCDTMLRLRGTPHLLETSYRVPSDILSFTQHNMVKNMTVSDNSECKSSIKGGSLEYIADISELSLIFQPSNSYFFLCRNKRFFKYFEKWCRDMGLPYSIKGVPIFSVTDKMEFREGKTSLWDPEKLSFAKDCYNKGTFYESPSINISTIHGVKGDEADTVVLMSDISKAVSSQLDIDEDSEHRVFYVACTRAKKQLVIVQPYTKLYYPYLF